MESHAACPMTVNGNNQSVFVLLEITEKKQYAKPLQRITLYAEEMQKLESLEPKSVEIM